MPPKALRAVTKKAAASLPGNLLFHHLADVSRTVAPSCVQLAEILGRAALQIADASHAAVARRDALQLCAGCGVPISGHTLSNVKMSPLSARTKRRAAAAAAAALQAARAGMVPGTPHNVVTVIKTCKVCGHANMQPFVSVVAAAQLTSELQAAITQRQQQQPSIVQQQQQQPAIIRLQQLQPAGEGKQAATMAAMIPQAGDSNSPVVAGATSIDGVAGAVALPVECVQADTSSIAPVAAWANAATDNMAAQVPQVLMVEERDAHLSSSMDTQVTLPATEGEHSARAEQQHNAGRDAVELLADEPAGSVEEVMQQEATRTVLGQQQQQQQQEQQGIDSTELLPQLQNMQAQQVQEQERQAVGTSKQEPCQQPEVLQHPMLMQVNDGQHHSLIQRVMALTAQKTEEVARRKDEVSGLQQERSGLKALQAGQATQPLQGTGEPRATDEPTAGNEQQQQQQGFIVAQEQENDKLQAGQRDESVQQKWWAQERQDVSEHEGHAAQEVGGVQKRKARQQPAMEPAAPLASQQAVNVHGDERADAHTQRTGTQVGVHDAAWECKGEQQAEQQAEPGLQRRRKRQRLKEQQQQQGEEAHPLCPDAVEALLPATQQQDSAAMSDAMQVAGDGSSALQGAVAEPLKPETPSSEWKVVSVGDLYAVGMLDLRPGLRPGPFAYSHHPWWIKKKLRHMAVLRR